MKFNLLLLVALSGLASAIPLSTKENENLPPHHKIEQPKMGSLAPKVPLSDKKTINALPPHKIEQPINNLTPKIPLSNKKKPLRKCKHKKINRINKTKQPKLPTNTKSQPLHLDKPTIHSFEPTKDNVKIIGRAKYMDNALWVGHTDSGIEFKMNGKRATIIVSTDSVYGSLKEDTYAQLYVYGDDELVLNVLTTEETMELNVEFDKVGKHTVRLIKITECQYGSIYIDEIKTDSKTITPTPSKDKKIEFIGDSITCAVGALEKEGNSLSTTADGTNSYAYMVAQKFNADYSIFSFGGYSIYGSNKGLLPPIYEKLGVLDWNIEHPENTTMAMSSVDWDPSEFEPDLIVINLGTNDKFYINGLSEDLREGEQLKFTDAYKDFLAQIRSVHPEAEILCTLGMMGQFLYQEIENAVKAYVKETNDDKVNVFPLSEEDIEKNGPGFYGHPGIQSHIQAANETIEQIEKLYGWIPDPKIDITKNKD